MSTKKSKPMKFLEGISGGPLSFGELIEAIRQGEEMTQVMFAKKLRISKSHLCDIEKGRKTVSPERAARFAKKLGYSEDTFVELALQDMVNEAKLDMKVSVGVA
jgi:transcriptional regulator with XRE-family HTH domain